MSLTAMEQPLLHVLDSGLPVDRVHAAVSLAKWFPQHLTRAGSVVSAVSDSTLIGPWAVVRLARLGPPWDGVAGDIALRHWAEERQSGGYEWRNSVVDLSQPRLDEALSEFYRSCANEKAGLDVLNTLGRAGRLPAAMADRVVEALAESRAGSQERAAALRALGRSGHPAVSDQWREYASENFELNVDSASDQPMLPAPDVVLELWSAFGPEREERLRAALEPFHASVQDHDLQNYVQILVQLPTDWAAEWLTERVLDGYFVALYEICEHGCAAESGLRGRLLDSLRADGKSAGCAARGLAALGAFDIRDELAQRLAKSSSDAEGVLINQAMLSRLGHVPSVAAVAAVMFGSQTDPPTAFGDFLMDVVAVSFQMELPLSVMNAEIEALTGGEASLQHDLRHLDSWRSGLCATLGYVLARSAVPVVAQVAAVALETVGLTGMAAWAMAKLAKADLHEEGTDVWPEGAVFVMPPTAIQPPSSAFDELAARYDELVRSGMDALGEKLSETALEKGLDALTILPDVLPHLRDDVVDHIVYRVYGLVGWAASGLGWDILVNEYRPRDERYRSIGDGLYRLARIAVTAATEHQRRARHVEGAAMVNILELIQEQEGKLQAFGEHMAASARGAIDREVAYAVSLDGLTGALAEREERERGEAEEREQAEKARRAERVREADAARAERDRKGALARQGRCVVCEQPMGFLERVGGRDRHKRCG